MSVYESKGVTLSDGVYCSNYVYHSSGVGLSNNLHNSNSIYLSDDVSASESIMNSRSIFGSSAVFCSEAINESMAVSSSFGVYNSIGVDNALFLANKPRTCSIFGVEVSEERFDKVWYEFFEILGDWLPDFIGASGDGKFMEEAWADMPKAAIEYLQTLPEFDPEMFFQITGIEVDEE